MSKRALPDLPPPTLIETRAGLDELVRLLEDVDEVAVDTEADSFFSYREKMCLVQVTAADQDFLIDPLARLDLEPLGEMFADPARTKIFHDSEFDVLLFKRTHDFEFAGLFDTRVAAAALGREVLGLAGVLEEEFGVSLDKSQQRSDWSRRPLSTAQIAYARLDTHFLPRLRARLEEQLDAEGRRIVAQSEFERLALLEAPAREFNADEYVRLKGARNLDLERQAVLRELFCTRDRLARERDVPPFKVLAHPALVQVAADLPRDAKGFARSARMRDGVAERVAPPFLAAIRRGRDAGPLERAPQLPPKDGTQGFEEADHELHDRLKKLRAKIASNDGFDASLVLNRHTLLALVRARPRSEEELQGIEGLHPWQRERYGLRIVRTVLRFEDDCAQGRWQPRGARRRR